MTTRQEGQTARIYQFPVQGTKAFPPHSDVRCAAAAIASPRVPIMESGGWYHEAEIAADRSAMRDPDNRH